MKTANGSDLADDLRVQESATGMWMYHLTRDGKALCGNAKSGLFDKADSVSVWGVVSHVPYRYCRKCEQIAIHEKGGAK